jgi:hypothetical protein
MYYPRTSSRVATVAQTSNLQANYLMGRIAEARDAVGTNLLTENETRDVVGRLIRDIASSRPAIFALAQDVKEGSAMASLAVALDEYAETGLLLGEPPIRGQVAYFLDALLHNYKKVMRQVR